MTDLDRLRQMLADLRMPGALEALDAILRKTHLVIADRFAPSTDGAIESGNQMNTSRSVRTENVRQISFSTRW